MKKRMMMIATLALAIYNIVLAGDKVTINDFKISAGETKEVSVSLTNDIEYVAFQFDLYLPEGITVESYSANRERIPESTTLSMKQQEDGAYRFISAAMEGESLVGYDGTIVTLTVKASESLSHGSLTGYFRKVKLSKADATGPTYSEMDFPITVIEPSVVTVTNTNRLYGDSNPSFEYTVTGGALDGEPEITCPATETSSVGKYPINISKGTVTNFNVTYVAGTLTITKAPLTITAKSYTITQGDALPTFDAEYSGFKNDETADILTKRPTLTTSVTSSSEPGTFDIVASGAEAQNYEISYAKGTLTINPGVYKLIYMVDGEVYKSYDVVYGDAITPEPEPTKEGYTFSGWSEIPETMPAHDVTVTGSFSINSYKLTYTVDGEVYKTYDIEYGATITPEAEPTKEGYYFSGWSEIPATMPAHDVTVTGSFSKGQYKLIYMLDGQTYKTISYDYGDAITPEPAPIREGYTFSGWSEIPATMPAHDVTVTGSFSINSYKLTYTVDGEVYKTYDLEYGATITPEAEPTKEGYTFSGWSTIPKTMPAHDVTITGTFIINKYKLTYIVDGEVYKTYEIEYGATITPEAEPTKEGYTFSGWSEIPETMPAHDVTVTGTFSINSYKLTYTVDGEVYKSYDIEYGASITPEAEPTKEGYTFSGWSTIPETMPGHDVTITGSFIINKYKLTYIVDGEVYKSYDIEYGASITPEAEPTKEGYTFSGWSTIPTTMPAYDVTITGSFTKGAYKLIYMLDGVVYKTISYDYGDAINPEPAPTKEGYTFSGWSEIPETMPAHDVTISGTFIINKYKLTYTVDGEVYKTYDIEYGATITPEAEPTKEGYNFSGWSEIPATMPAHDVTVTGSFSKGQYKLIYMLDGQTYKTISYDYGDAITPEPAPIREGYTFSGWSEIPATMPAHDVTVTGSFSINSYKLTYTVDGEVYKTYDIEYGATITPEAEPTKEGYTFSGWSTIPETMPAHDVTISGTFIINKYKLTYVVDGEVYKTYEMEYGATITPETEPSKEGYTFSGWSTIPVTMPAHDVTVIGTFSINSYKLIYTVDGEVYKSYDIEYGASITPEAEPTKEGYTFSGWSTIPTTMPAYDVTITGSFTKGAYKLIYMLDGVVYKTISYDYGDAINPEPAPTKEGYTFSGWSEIPETMPAHDVTVTGSFSINSYKLTYTVDGEVYKTYEMEYGATITPEVEPTKEGYTFSGWSEIPATMPAHDVTVTGTFTLDTGIEEIMSNVNGDVMIFTIDGKRVDNLKKGMNVIRMKDGTTRKVVVK